MYIAGVLNKPDTFMCYHTEHGFNKRIKELCRRKEMSWFIHLPDVHRVWLCGIKGKMDTLTIFTTSEEMHAQHAKFLKFYTPREIYLLALGDEANDG